MNAKTAAKTNPAKQSERKKLPKNGPTQRPNKNAAVQTAERCPRGGKHAWSKDADGKFCGKCQAPQGKQTPPTPAPIPEPQPAPPVSRPLQPTEAVTKPAAAPSVSPKRKQLGCIDAAARVLAASKVPMTSRELIAAMAAQNLWTSPAGQTPHATLYSAILREMKAQGQAARFVKTDRGRFALQGAK